MWEILPLDVTRLSILSAPRFRPRPRNLESSVLTANLLRLSSSDMCQLRQWFAARCRETVNMVETQNGYLQQTAKMAKPKCTWLHVDWVMNMQYVFDCQPLTLYLVGYWRVKSVMKLLYSLKTDNLLLIVNSGLFRRGILILLIQMQLIGEKTFQKM